MLVARLNSDVALTDFEIAVRDLVSNVENAYWDLYYGYRVLDDQRRVVTRLSRVTPEDLIAMVSTAR